MHGDGQAASGTQGQKKRIRIIFNNLGCKPRFCAICICSPGTWMCADCLLSHVVDGVMTVSSEHWIQCNFFRVFWLLALHTIVDNLIMYWKNDQLQTKSWQYVGAVWYLQCCQRVSYGFVMTVSKSIEFNFLAVTSSGMKKEMVWFQFAFFQVQND